ncbi:MAG: lipopolysaccharide core heptose(I) kinase RfaP [Cycloclasticus sp.]|nr:lipopolysaccharide core heptose(I) kinase RfaP [Cycloclasticus sp.]MBG96646.1 lipopolysaccharide core heptose(I) kinase RfaP [Cycloclasticus sp.]HAI97215.1 lipopolysaccharide core heptose(I) kinase RfaP [Methylococcaceae bacterium]|tara:strand:- start:100 stop:903 length:804 start_codon:yes stop_codon:yes gene_type:complete
MQFELTETFKNNWGTSSSFDELMALEGEIYRQVARRKTLKFSMNGRVYFAKIHQGVGWGEIFKNLFQGRLPILGAKNEYDALGALHQLGIKTMNLAAYGRRGFNLAEQESFVVTESLEPAVSLEDFCADWALHKPPFKLKRALIKRVAKITRTLHENGINHRDLYICHFLLKEGELESLKNVDDVALYLIDLHRVQIRDKTPKRWQIKDLAALYFSSMELGLSRYDLSYFMSCYTGEPFKCSLQKNKALWKAVEQKALRLKAKSAKP